MVKKLKIPSLQHLSRNWRENPTQIQKELVRLAKNSPTFNYIPLFSAVNDLLVLGQSFEQVYEGISIGVKRENVRDNFLEVLPLIQEYFDGVSPNFYQTVAMRYYPIGQDLVIPFSPPLIYGVGGQICFPWFSFWRTNPLKEQNLSLFVTLVEEMLLQDPDLDEAKFEILDFSAPKGDRARALFIQDARDIPRVSHSEKTEMLEIFAEGFLRAQNQLVSEPEETDKDVLQILDSRQIDLFDS
ncbi:hypothetical protein [Sneathiella sp.]|uniref:hypothetical protein n=1 Tax=Sneathiella sp. TaxID=1964365 RepID=UPI00260E6411|nr:hypothetical protein [Sneathiella sp.]MDF2369033.1 hypothetical protein [Sneathiella sp.]